MPYKDKRKKRTYDRQYYNNIRRMAQMAKTFLDKEVYEAENVSPAPILKGNNFVLFSDLHCPRHSKKWLKVLIDKIVEENQKIGVCIGDLFDWEELTKWFTFGKPVSSIKTLKSGINALKAMVHVLDELHVLCGNHDLRLFRELSETRFKDSKDLWWNIINEFSKEPKIIWHKHTNAVLKTKLGEVWLVHQDTYSRDAGKVEKNIAAVHHKNIIGTHGHLFGVTFDVSGKFLCSQIGHCSEPKKIEYKQEKVTTHPQWVRGFATLKDAKFRPFADHPMWRN